MTETNLRKNSPTHSDYPTQELSFADLRRRLAAAEAQLARLQQAHPESFEGEEALTPELLGETRRTLEQLESDHQAAEAQRWMLLDRMPVGIWLLDESGRVVYMNPAGQSIWEGAPYVEMADFGVYKGWWFESGEPVGADEWGGVRAVQKGEMALNDVIEIRAFNGEHKVIRNSAIPVHDADGKVLGALVVNEEITQLKATERALQRLNNELEMRIQERTEELRRSKEMFQKLFEAAPDPHLLVGSDGLIRQANQETERVFGYTLEELNGQPIERLLPGRFREKHPGQRATYFARPAIRPMGSGLDLYARKKDGEELPVDVTLSPVEVGDELQVICIVHDIRVRKETEEKLRSQNARIEVLAELSRLLAETETDLAKVLQTVVRCVSEEIGDTSTLALLSKDGAFLEPAAYYHPDAEALALIEQMAQTPHRADQGSLGKVVQSGEALRIAGIDQAAYRKAVPADYQRYLDRFGIHDLLIVPLRARGRSIGTLAVSRDRPGASYTQEDQVFLQELADQASLAILNAQLFASLQKELAERRRIEAELVELQRRLMDSVEAERLLLAQELHDGPIQEIIGVIYQLAAYEAVPEAERGEDLARELQTRLLAINTTLRNTARDLRPPALMDFGLERAIRDHVGRFQQNEPNLRIELDLQPDAGVLALDQGTRLALFRIVQVALTNVLRHAQATWCKVSFHFDAEDIRVEIQDDGCGFEVPAQWIDFARDGHLGLAGAAERASAAGGRLEVRSRPAEGTTLRVVVPARGR